VKVGPVKMPALLNPRWDLLRNGIYENLVIIARDNDDQLYLLGDEVRPAIFTVEVPDQVQEGEISVKTRRRKQVS